MTIITGFRITVVNPHTRLDDSALSLSELQGWQLFTQLAGSSDPFTAVGVMNSPSTLTKDVTNLAPGSYNIRVVWYDTYNQASPPRDSGFVIPMPPAPSAGDISSIVGL